MSKWKDASSYSQSDKVRAVNCVKAEFGDVDVSVHRHIHHPGKWLVYSRSLGIEQQELKSEGLSDAQIEARAFVAGVLDQRITNYKKALTEVAP